MWKIGAMEAHEVRTLTYKVKLKEGYTGGHSKGSVVNTAKAYSKTYPRQEAKSTFTPKAGMTLKKTAGEFQKEADGTACIEYKVWVQAYKDNTYTLDNVKIYDSLKGDPNLKTDEKLYPYLTYIEDSFQLYKVNSTNAADKISVPEREGGAANPVIDNKKDSAERKFECYIGDMKPGEERTLVYRMKVDEGIYCTGNGDINIINYAILYPDDRVSDGPRFERYRSEKNFSKKTWDRKIQNEKTTSEQTVTIPQNDKVYGYDLAEESASLRSFTLPAGSLKYQVIVNEDGQWNISSSNFTDEISKYLRYTGYLRLDYYEGGLKKDAADDAAALKQLREKTPTETSWINIQDQQTFSFQPGQVFGKKGSGAYLLTYYAVPYNTENISQTVSGNSFDLKGKAIGPGGQTHNIAGVRVEASAVIEGGAKLSAKKDGWYYDSAKDTGGDWQRGHLYWVIDVTGNEVSKGTVFRDTPVRENNIHLMRRSTMIGVYTGKLPEGQNFTGYYKSTKDLSEDSILKKLSGNRLNGEKAPEGADYFWSATNEMCTIEMKKTVALEKGEHLYIVLRTAPQNDIGIRDVKEFRNKLEMKGSESRDFIEENTATLTANGAGTNFKEAIASYTYDGTDWVKLKKNLNYADSDITKLLKDRITEPGIYIEWRLHINYHGDLKGKVQAEDLLPEGLQLAYVRYFDRADALAGDPPVITEIAEYEGNPSWEKQTVTAPGDRTSAEATCISYYNKAERRIRFDVDNLKDTGQAKNAALEIQVVTKVTDPEVLLGGQEKTFRNGLRVKGEDGEVITDSTADISVTATTLTKKRSTIESGKVPFTIEVNPLGTDLVKGSDKITLVDELKSPLHFDPDSLVIEDAKGNQLAGISPKIETTDEGEKMLLTIPDDQKLTIRYQTAIAAPPESEFTINNCAYWFGYSKDVAKVEESGVKYSIESLAETTTKPALRVRKLDQEDTSKVLRGAEFTLREVTYDADADNWKEADGSSDIKKTTGSDGIAVFGKDETLKYNTVYRLQETKAPDGYIQDTSVKYIAIGKKTGEAGSEAFPAELKAWQQKGVSVYYLGATYTCTVYNRKGSLRIEKTFQNVNGEEVTGVQIADGTYAFGLYAEEGDTFDYSTERPLQILKITVQNGNIRYQNGDTSTEKPEFTGLATGTSYRVYELDASGRAITESGSKYTAENGQKFQVTYGKIKATISPDGTAEAIRITNKQKNDIPLTGVTAENRKLYFLMLAGVAAILCFRLNKRIRRSA